MKKIVIVFAVLVGLLSTSCEEFLNKEYKNGFVDENFMKSEAQAEEALTAIYDVLNYEGLYGWGFHVLQVASADNTMNDWGDGSYGPDLVRIAHYEWYDNNRFFTLMWNHSYAGISRANYFLSKIDDVADMSDTQKQTSKGQALFLRALYYYNMVVGFGSIPVITDVISPVKANSATKAPEADVWAQIVNDLNEASGLLPDSYSSKSDIGRITKSAAYGLLSRVLLWTKDYQGAINAAQKAKTGHQLVSSDKFSYMFDGSMENSSESLFEVQRVLGFGGFWGSTSEQSLMIHILPRVSWCQYFRPRRYTGDFKYNITDIFESKDIRRKASILISSVDSMDYGAGGKRIFPDLSFHSDFRVDLQEKGALQMKKFLPRNSIFWKDYKNFAYNFPVIRLAEVILNEAEANLALGKTAAAWENIKTIRERAGLTMSGISNSDNAALTAVMKKERRIELMFEGHRWTDLKRWNELDKLKEAGVPYNGQKYWPIPAIETAINPNLK